MVNTYRILFQVNKNKVNSKLEQAVYSLQSIYAISRYGTYVVSNYIYPIIIFIADISSTFNKGFHCGLLAFSNCNVQGSPLIERLHDRKFKSFRNAILIVV